MEEMRDEMDGEEREEEDETGTEEMTACTECIYFIPITRCRERKNQCNIQNLEKNIALTL